MAKIADLESYFDDKAEGYLGGFIGSPGREYLDEADKRAVLWAVSGLSGKRVLDIGSGPGRFVEILQKNNEVVAFDLSMGMLHKVKGRLGSPCVKGDSHALPFKENTFDIILSIRQIKYAEDYQVELREISRCLTPGGLLILEFPSLFSVAAFHRRGFLNVFSPKEVATSLNQCGLTVKKSIGARFLPDSLFIRSKSSKAVRLLGTVEAAVGKIAPLRIFAKSLFFVCQKM